jgi:hypothetical protein
MPLVFPYILLGLGIAICGLFGWVLYLQIRLRRLSEQYARLMAGANGIDLEGLLNQHVDDVREALDTVSELETRTRTMERTMEHTVQWIGIVRYNPFRNTGGAQSFALAVVDARGDGFVLSSLHARENTRVYAKPLNQWESEYTLTDEEKEAASRARRQQTLGLAQNENLELTD